MELGVPVKPVKLPLCHHIMSISTPRNIRQDIGLGIKFVHGGKVAEIGTYSQQCPTCIAVNGGGGRGEGGQEECNNCSGPFLANALLKIVWGWTEDLGIPFQDEAVALYQYWPSLSNPQSKWSHFLHHCIYWHVTQWARGRDNTIFDTNAWGNDVSIIRQECVPWE